jgi:hypothetical protein
MPQTPAAEKSQEVQALLKRLVEAQGVPVHFISAFGHKFDSAFWIAVGTDRERDQLKADRTLLARLNAVFEESGYQRLVEDIWEREVHMPALAYLKTMGIVFESQETVDRDYQGNWYYCMK